MRADLRGSGRDEGHGENLALFSLGDLSPRPLLRLLPLHRPWLCSKAPCIVQKEMAHIFSNAHYAAQRRLLISMHRASQPAFGPRPTTATLPLFFPSRVSPQPTMQTTRCPRSLSPTAGPTARCGRRRRQRPSRCSSSCCHTPSTRPSHPILSLPGRRAPRRGIEELGGDRSAPRV